MTDTRERPRRRAAGSGIVWPLILIAAGLLFLLDNLGLVNVHWWDLWRLWPLLLILGGLDLLLGGRSAMGNLVVALVGLVILGGVVYVITTGSVRDLGSPGSRHTVTAAQTLDGAELAEFDVRLGAGDLWIEALAEPSLLASGELQVQGDDPTWQATRDGSTVRMTLDQAPGREGSFDLDLGDEWRLWLSPHAGFALDVNLGAGTARLDLTGLDLRELVVETGAGGTEITLPATGDYQARIKGGVGDTRLIIPRGVAVRLQLDRGLTTLNLPDRYGRQGDVYVTEDWAGAEDRVELFVDVGVGLLTIRDG